LKCPESNTAGPSGGAILLGGGGSALLVAALAVAGWYVARPVAEVRQVLKRYDSGIRLAISFERERPPEYGSLNARLAWRAKYKLPSIGRGLVQVGEDRWVSAPMLPAFEAIEELGGRHRAAGSLSLYLRMPECVAPDRDLAGYLLKHCNSELFSP